MFAASRVFLLVLVFTCYANAVFSQKNKVIGIKKTACYGSCPVYSMDILRNCKVILNAEQFLQVGQGKFKSKLTKRQFDDLISDFKHSGFFELNDFYRSNTSDLPTTFFYFKNQNNAKTIEVYGKWPEELKALEKKLDLLIDELKWKKVSNPKN